jgi:acyl-CoA thioesterase
MEADHPEKTLAEHVAAAMFAKDRATRSLGITIHEVAEGFARLSMRVRTDMLNGMQTCHGGIIFMFADSALAFACNSRNELSVAASCLIEFLAPVQENAVLTAVASERYIKGRTGIYDVMVSDEAGQTVALFRGKSHRIKGEPLVKTPPQDGPDPT